MDKNKAILLQLGLSDQEAAAYLSLLKLGNAQATDLAIEMGIKRTTAYPILARLKEEGLVTEYKQGRKSYYSPLKPNRAAQLFEKKLKAFTNIVPALESLSQGIGDDFGVRFIQSKKELERFYDNILEEYAGREYYVIGSTPTWIGLSPDFFLDFRRKRASRNIKVKLLLSADSKGQDGQDDASLLREFKYLPSKYKFRSTIDIYDNKVIIVGPEIKALAVVIAIPPMVDTFRSVFEALWESLKTEKQS